MPADPICTCRILLGGAAYTDECDIHSTLPPLTACPRCPALIGRGQPRIKTADGLVHPECADIRERLDLDRVTTPGERAERERGKRARREDLPVHMQPGVIARLRRRRR